jgi:4-aminobutyrate aminotransferase-like enzyme
MNRPTMINAFDPSRADDLAAETKRLIERRSRVLGPSYRLFYERPIHVVRSEGVWLIDVHGDKYLDVYNNVPCVGHCHPTVVEAIARQSSVLNTHTRYLFDSVVDYAERLVATFPNALGNVMFTCTGSEAVDLATRIACSQTRGSGIIVTANAYHGVTSAVAAFSPSLGAGVALGSHVRTVPAPDTYRVNADVALRLASDVEAAAQDLKRHGIQPAAFICDSIFSSDGVYVDPPGFLAPAVERIRAAGGLFIADEVQPGFARTGHSMWGFARHNVTPDLVVLGKPMGNGMPIAGVVARPELLEEFGRKSRYFNTFAGNPVSCAAASAVLDVIERDDLLKNAASVGALLLQGLKAIARDTPSIGDVRGAGLFLGVEFVTDHTTRGPAPELALSVVNRLRERNVLISASGPHGNVLKIRPPLVFTVDHAALFLDTLREVVRDLDLLVE